MNCAIHSKTRKNYVPDAEIGERIVLFGIATKKITYCFECSKFPCKRLKQLDLRYKTKYSLSMLEKLAFIKEKGETAFLQQQEDKYTCPDCGKLHTVHYGYCIYCKQNKQI